MNPSARRLLFYGALLMALATIVGAMGAHAIKPHLPVDRYEVLQTAVHYQFFHALGLLALGLIAERIGEPGLRRIALAGTLLLAGIVLFSGSLYALLIPGVPRLVGVITPLGGSCLIAGWLLAAYALAASRRAPPPSR